ncbi:serine hydrolase domain-containing protein [Pseudohongiella acticola]|nr:serine hydrolase domain-containing protein [Pseudohongiella acticola]
MSVRSIIAILVLVVFAGLIYLIWPAYGFMAETNPSLRNPWRWQDVPVATTCQSSPMAPDLQSIAEQACALLLAHQARVHAPSLSAAVAIDGRLVWSGAVGWADLGSQSLATPQTLYRIGSTSKPVTGTLLARMVDAGIVELDQPIGHYDDALPNSDWQHLTLRQLASHMAGLPEYETNRDTLGLYHSMALRRGHSDVREGLALFDGSPQRYAAGSAFEYSSFGALLIASVLQSAGGQPYADLVQQWVLEPLALNSPVVDQAVTGRASFYQLDGSRVQPWRRVDLSNKLPGGGFMSRPEDMVRLGAAWLDPGFVNVDTRERFWTPQTLNNGNVNEQSYALTWRWSDTGNYAHHGGVSKGAMAWLAVHPEQSMVIALTTNVKLAEFGDFSSVQDSLVALFSKNDDSTQIDASE